ncbi:MAG TPA: hypothetical protein VFX05_06955, partial [Casimicrobiaceae bacterium]|nr:hypothetical protein [Casimicrobiaceae bacterium]
MYRIATRTWLTAAVAVVAASLVSWAHAEGKARQRPLSDFLDTQGSQVTYIPPVPDYWGWTAPPPGVKTPASSYVGGNAASCDYAGIAEAWLVANGHPGLGTSFKGSVSERALDDGRILVHVELRTTNALVFGLRITLPPYGDFATDPLIFGARAPDVLAGATPGIGECHASFAWKQSPGALIDYNHGETDPNFEIVNLSFRAHARGPLAALAGYGPDGTPGMLFISESGFARTTFKGATA